jgi:uncharacterized membrane protein (DUF4010 family)
LELSAEPLQGFATLGIALAIGLIVGFERGWHAPEDEDREGQRVAGIRTFAVTGLLGGALGLLAAGDGAAVILPAGLLALAALLTAGYVLSTRASADLGATTETALLLTFALGALPAFGHAREAVAAAVVAAALLGFKTRIHETLLRLELRELQASLQLLLIALVLLPLLPDRSMGPWDAVNPRMIGLLVLLIAGIGFAGYLAMRNLGERSGLLLTAVLGGLVSSTAATASFSRMARHASGTGELAGAAIALACATMAPRMLLTLSFVSPSLVLRLLPVGLALTAVPLAAGLWLARGRARARGSAALQVENPLALRQALALGLLLSAVFVLAHGAEALLGDRGVYALALIAGIADVDAISLSLARQAGASLDPAVAARGVLLAALANTLVKAGIAAFVGGRALARTASLILVGTFAAGAALLPFV